MQNWEQIKLELKTWDEKKYYYVGYPNDSVLRLKNFIAKNLSVNASEISISFNGKNIESFKGNLQDFDIEDGSVLRVSLMFDNYDTPINFGPNEMANYICRWKQDEKKEVIKGSLNKGANNNRIYSINGVEKAPGFIPTTYTKPLIYANEPYYCPNGWRRLGLYVGLSKEEFANRYENWPVCYHGTSWKSAREILVNGFRSFNNSSCWISKTDKAVFVTPSIVYAGHPRYAKIQKYDNLYVQIVLQLRIKADCIHRKPGTLENTFSSNQKAVDENYKNNDQLEWIFIWNSNACIKPADGIIVYGIMARISRKNPRFVKGNEWWEESRSRLKWDSYEQN